MKRRILAMLMAVLMLSTILVGCSDKPDLQYVLDNGEMIIGITYYAPMDFKDGDKLVGFDHDLAEAVCKELGVTAKFQEIDWATKENELNSKTIDVIWNGMTVTPERAQAMSLTANYMRNKQVIVVRKTDAEAIKTQADLVGKKGIAEAGSAGEELIKKDADLEKDYVSAKDQATALLEVKGKTSDYCVIDAVMANYLVGAGTDYADLTVLSGILNAEEEYYAAACRKGSDLTAKINQILVKLWENGTIAQIAAKYGLSDVIVPIVADGAATADATVAATAGATEAQTVAATAEATVNATEAPIEE